jgi:putative addiction module killer protein
MVDPVPREILICHTNDGGEPFSEWLDALPPKVRGIVRNRIDRLEEGNLGDTRRVGEGVSELRIDFGPGYRVYLGQVGNQVHLIRGGAKASQKSDIEIRSQILEQSCLAKPDLIENRF